MGQGPGVKPEEMRSLVQTLGLVLQRSKLALFLESKKYGNYG